MANAKAFTGRAQAYTKARPSYPIEAIQYIRELVKKDSIFADVGAGTGKFTELLAQYGYTVFAVEPNADMREQLSVALAPYPNAHVVGGAAEATTLPSHSVDVITNAQALNWFNIEAFRAECHRIGKPDATIITLHNYNPDEDASSALRYDQSTSALYRNPVVRMFQNPALFSRENWLLYHSSMSGVPGASDPGYEEYFAALIEKFDRNNVDGLLRHDLMTRVFCEKLSEMPSQGISLQGF